MILMKCVNCDDIVVQNKQLLEEALQKEEEIRQKEEKFSQSLQNLDSILTLQKSRMEKMIGAIRP